MNDEEIKPGTMRKIFCSHPLGYIVTAWIYNPTTQVYAAAMYRCSKCLSTKLPEEIQ